MFNLTGHAVHGIDIVDPPSDVRISIAENLQFKELTPPHFLMRAFRLTVIAGCWYATREFSVGVHGLDPPKDPKAPDGCILIDAPPYFAPYLTNALSASGFKVCMPVYRSWEAHWVDSVVEAPVGSHLRLMHQYQEENDRLRSYISAILNVIPGPDIPTPEGVLRFVDPRPVQERFDALVQTLAQARDAIQAGVDPFSRLVAEREQLFAVLEACRNRLREYEGPWDGDARKT